MIDISELEEKITHDTLLVSIMHVNNETGNIYPVEEVGNLTRARGVIFHCDAVQSFGKIDVNPDKIKADLVSVSSHKIYGPKGAGALYIRKGVILHPVMFGGKQERGYKPGTENVPAIVGFGEACRIINEKREIFLNHYKKLMDRMWSRIISEIDGVKLNGHPEKRIPTTLNLSFDGVEGESVVLNLDLHGIAVSTGSACSSGSTEPSHVLLAMGLPEEVAEASVRFSIGLFTTPDDIEYTVDVLKRVIFNLREISPSYRKHLKTA
jgi:cysteine desulfurase